MIDSMARLTDGTLQHCCRQHRRPLPLPGRRARRDGHRSHGFLDLPRDLVTVHGQSPRTPLRSHKRAASRKHRTLHFKRLPPTHHDLREDDAMPATGRRFLGESDAEGLIRHSAPSLRPLIVVQWSSSKTRSRRRAARRRGTASRPELWRRRSAHNDARRTLSRNVPSLSRAVEIDPRANSAIVRRR
jgi:hypothetical protein